MLKVDGPKLFNCLPAKIRNLTKCSVDEFKTKLNLVLSKVPDEPKISGYVPSACDQFSGNPFNSIVDQIRGVELDKNPTGKQSPGF